MRLRFAKTLVPRRNVGICLIPISAGRHAEILLGNHRRDRTQLRGVAEIFLLIETLGKPGAA